MFGTPALFLKRLFSDGSQSLAILDGQPIEGMLQSLGREPAAPCRARRADGILRRDYEKRIRQCVRHAVD